MQQYPNLNIIVDNANKDANNNAIADVIKAQLILYKNTHTIPDNYFSVIEKYVESFVKDSISLWKCNAIDVRTNFNTVGTYTEFYAHYNISNFLSFKVYLRISNKN